MYAEPTDSYESNSSLYLVFSNNVRHSNTRPVTPLGTTNGVSFTSRVAPPKIARSKRPFWSILRFFVVAKLFQQEYHLV